MKKIIFILSIFIYQFSFADELLNKVKPFTAVCTEEAKTGFIWKNNNWVQTNFIETKKIIKKISLNEIPNNLTCAPPSVIHNGDYSFVKACYNIRSKNEEFSPILSIMCHEKYINKNLTSVFCDGLFETIKFKPNGNFIRNSMYSELDNNPPDGRKDSISISVGFCATID